jgi:4-hydroxybenzoate polyprenyltransferase
MHAIPESSMTMLRKLLELIRFSHTIFALPFAMLSSVLAWQLEDFRILDLIGILLALVLARSAAMAFNRLVDRHWDALNPRTAQRHLPAGTLSVRAVWLFTISTMLAFLLSTGLFLLRTPANPWPAYLALPVLLFVLGYSLTKRFTSLAHFWLGVSLMLAPVAAWIAIRGIVSFQDMSVPLLLGTAVLFWVSGFDILYACQDADFDRKVGLHSIPARLGIRNSLRLAALCHAIMFCLLIGLGFLVPGFGVIYFAGLALIATLLIYEHWIVRPDDLTRVNQAFFQVNGIISMGLLLLVILQLIIKK